MGNRGVLVNNRHPIIPAPIFRGVINRRHYGNAQHASKLDLFLQHRVMILPKERQELVRVTPLRLVVVLNDKRLFRGHALRRRTVSQSQNKNEARSQQTESQHRAKTNWSAHKSSSLNLRIVACFEEKGTQASEQGRFQ